MFTEKRKEKQVLTCILFISLPCLLFGQAAINGKVQSTDIKPIVNASVLLLNSKDSSLVKGNTTNNDGLYRFEKIQPGKYLIVCSYTGHTDEYLPSFDVDNKTIDMGTTTLAALNTQLSGVVVTGQKPMFEQKIDRMVINVKSSITNAGGTVLEVLEKSPGVVVDRSSGSVSLNGKSGVMVMINGKLSYIPQDALLQMLNGMNANNVEKIELITTPPAKYEAAGNAGYINIVLLANPDEGFNGSYSLTGSIGAGPVVNASTNFNYRKNNLNLYGSYTFSRDAQEQEFRNYRSVVNNGDLLANEVISNRDPYQRNHNARLGLDYKAGKKTVFGVLVGGYDNKWGMDAVNNSRNTINGQPDTSIVIDNQEINHWKNAMMNLNMQHTFKQNEELSFNADYLYYNDKNPTDYQNKYYNGEGDYLYSENSSSGKETNIKIFAAQADYAKKLTEKSNMEMGVRTSLSSFTNDVLVQRQQNGAWKPDPRFTANYFLHENIYAGYLSADTKLGEKTNLKAGLRYEYTTSNLGSETEKNIVDRKYGRLFPTVYLSHQLTEKQSVNFSYNRRIDRPSFTQLAPFLIFFDPKTFITGNPALQPSITDAVKLDYLVGKYVFTVSYSYEDNPIGRFVNEVDSTDNSQITRSQNLENSQLIFVSASLPLRFTNWWSSPINVSLNWERVKAEVNKEMLDITQFSYRINGSESFKLRGNYSIELSGFYQSKSIFGAAVAKPFGMLNIAAQKKFPKLSASLTLGVDNVLNSLKFRVSQSIPSQNIESSGYFLFTQRMYKISWSQNFGNNALKAKRDRATASDELQSRVE